MIIFGGWGSIVMAVVLGGGLALSNAVFGEGRITNFATALLGVAIFLFGQFLHDEDVSTVVDPATGETRTMRKRHHLFFIPVRWWGALAVVAGLWGTVAPQ